MKALGVLKRADSRHKAPKLSAYCPSLGALCNKNPELPYYIDPMTYVYGEYANQATGEVYDDLKWLKSERKVKGTKKKALMMKPSYVDLGDRYKSVIGRAVAAEKAVAHEDLLTQEERLALAKAVVEYQRDRVRKVFIEDEGFPEAASDIPMPAAVFAPYFYCDPTASLSWLSRNIELATAAAPLGGDVPVHAILCADEVHLTDEVFITQLLETLPSSGVKGVWLWFSRFAEERATLLQLQNFRRIVTALAQSGLEVHNLHGGFFSLALSKVGLRGISHGIGYGEQKDVTPQLGRGVPWVRYYLPAVHRRLGVRPIARAFDGIGIESVQDFYEKVCGCVVCRGLVASELAEFVRYFGDTKPSAGPSGREVQTPQAARRCRFHFLLARLKERDDMVALSLPDVRADFDEMIGTWGKQPSVAEDTTHLGRWRDALA